MKVDENVKPRKGDLCIKASAPEMEKTGGPGDSGGPLYLVIPSLGELVMIT